MTWEEPFGGKGAASSDRDATIDAFARRPSFSALLSCCEAQLETKKNKMWSLLRRCSWSLSVRPRCAHSLNKVKAIHAGFSRGFFLCKYSPGSRASLEATIPAAQLSHCMRNNKRELGILLLLDLLRQEEEERRRRWVPVQTGNPKTTLWKKSSSKWLIKRV